MRQIIWDTLREDAFKILAIRENVLVAWRQLIATFRAAGLVAKRANA